MPMAPTMPSTTTTTSHAYPPLVHHHPHHHAHHAHHHSLADHDHQQQQHAPSSSGARVSSATSPAEPTAQAWADPSSLPINALDMWLEHATAGPSSSNLSLNLDLVMSSTPTGGVSNVPLTSTPLSTPALTPNTNANEHTSTFNMTQASLADIIANPQAAFPIDFSAAENNNNVNNDATTTTRHTNRPLNSIIPTPGGSNGNLNGSSNNNNNNNSNNNVNMQSNAVPSTPTLSNTTNPLSSTPTPPAPLSLSGAVANNMMLGHNVNANFHMTAAASGASMHAMESTAKNPATAGSKKGKLTGRGKGAKGRGKAKSTNTSSKVEKTTTYNDNNDNKNQNNYSSTIASRSDSPISQSESQSAPGTKNASGPGPSSLTGASSSKDVDGEETMDVINALTTSGASPSDGMSAVDRAKRSAEQFTMSQLAKRRRKGQSPFPGSMGSPSEEENGGVNGGGEENENEHGPEAESHRKYQKRLQKNRDSAYVSRIRRREYTRILETSLSAVEKEKDAAMAAFREMKRRFDVVSAELAGIKTAAASNFRPFVNPVVIPDMPAGVFIPPAEVGFHPGSYYPHKSQGQFVKLIRDVNGNAIPTAMTTVSMQTNGAHGHGTRHGHDHGHGHRHAQQNQGVVGTSRPLMTTMYMVALVVGVLLPDFASRKTISTTVSTALTGGRATRSGDTGTGTERLGTGAQQRMRGEDTTSETEADRLRTFVTQHGKAGRMLPGVESGSTDQLSSIGIDASQGAADRLVDAVQADAAARLGAQLGARTVEAVRRHLRTLSHAEVQTVEQLSRDDGTHSGFEAVLRAVLKEDGDSVKDEDDLDEIVSQVAGLNFEDRL